jgi:hypothetical protein
LAWACWVPRCSPPGSRTRSCCSAWACELAAGGVRTCACCACATGAAAC